MSVEAKTNPKFVPVISVKSVMKKLSYFLFVFLFLSVADPVLSQSSEFVDPGHMTCSTNHYTEAFFQKYPEQRELAEKARKQLDAETLLYSAAKDTEDDLLIIPVVFHIVHLGGDENISDEQVRSAIDVMNEDFTASNSDIGEVVDEFAGIVGDVQMEFRLAKIDPQGNCTNGINRIFSVFTDEGFENMKQAAPIWDRSSYLNIWVCRQIGEGTAGYTFQPSSVNGIFGQAIDGIVILHNYVGRIGTSNGTRSHALSHEVGHWANLSHTWGGSNTPGVDSNCGDNDDVADTPNTIGWTSCNLNGVTCGSLDNVENFMDYSYCYKMFTQGQSNRMRAAMNSSIAQRNQLYSPANLAETGLLEPAEICFADFITDKTPKICAGQEIQFEDISYNEVEERIWTFEGGTPSTSSEVTPTVMYEDEGVYSVTLSVSNSQGLELVVKEGLVNVIEEAQQVAPLAEGFENMNNLEEDSDWIDVNQDNSAIGWSLTPQTSFSGDQCVFVRGRNNQDYQQEVLESPVFDISQMEDVEFSFKYAHARRNANSDDGFRVLISRDCGETWILRLDLDIMNLPTVSGNRPGQFIPESDDDWEEVVISTIGSFFMTDQFRIKFEFINVKGNNIFIDDINIYDPNSLSVQNNDYVRDLTLFPNPATAQVALRLDLNKNQNARIDLVDALGRIVQSPFNGLLTSGSQNIQIQLDPTLHSGIYFVRLTSSDGVATRKLMID